jgi:LuxR family maltose regulon positive regulatory protein
MNEIAALKVFAISFSQDYEHAIVLAEACLRRPPLKHRMASQFIRCNILHLLGSMYFATGQIVKAEQTCLETIEFAKEIGFTLRYLHSFNKLMLIYKITGRLVIANQRIEETQSYLRGHGYSNYFAALQLYFRKIGLLYEWNRLDEVQNLVDLVLQQIGMIDPPYLHADFHNIQAHLLLIKGDYSGSQRELDQARALARQAYIWEGIAWRTESLQIMLCLQQGDIARAIALISEGAEDSSDIIPFSREVTMVARARILLAQENCEDAIALLERLTRSAELGERKGGLIEILALKAIALQSAGKSAGAVAEIEKALALAKPEGYVRTFIDEGKPMQILLYQWVRQAGTSPLREYANYLLSQFDVDSQDTTTEQQKLSANAEWIEPLTSRELEVLRLAAKGFSNRQIGQKLFLAEGTVKFYMHAIMAKLGVHSRTSAIATAREQSLL